MIRPAIRRLGMAAATLLIAAGTASLLDWRDGGPGLHAIEIGPTIHPADPPTEDELLLKKFSTDIAPLPLEPIPDNPPPHEGAMIQLSYRIEPPDIILVEVLEAFPGRPITGERLVQPDGTISLQWYGELSVVGLTKAQVRTKIVNHLRAYLTDQALGLIAYDEGGGRRTDRKGVIPPDPLPELPPEVEDFPTPLTPTLPPIDTLEGVNKAPGTPTRPTEAPASKGVEPTNHPNRPKNPDVAEMELDPLPTTPIRGDASDRRSPLDPEFEQEIGREAPADVGGRYVHVDPSQSNRVFVDVTAYNSKVYFVLGEVGAPGRMPWSGKETVLDALQFAGGLLPPLADRGNIRLNRPARGGQPARSYRIDLDGIELGDKRANLQLFPGDRLIVGRKGKFKLPVP